MRMLSRKKIGLLALIIVCFGLITLSYSVLIEPDSLSVREISGQVPLLNIPLRIAIIADPHFRPQDLPRLEQIVASINAEEVDLVLLLGDYVAGQQSFESLEPEEIAAGLGKLRSRYGSYAVLGNHDWWQGGEKIRKAFEQHGIPVLENSSIELTLEEGETLYLAGVADFLTRKVDIPKTFADIPPGEPVILLSHSPDVVPDLPKGAAYFAVAGHTHGGQVKIPLIGAPIIPSEYGRRYAEGWVAEPGDIPVFISRGSGTSMLRIRFNCPPEVVIMQVPSVEQ